MPKSSPTLPRTKQYIMAGLLLLIFPLLIIVFQSYRMESGTMVRLPAQINSAKPTLTTPLNTVDTTKVTGHNRFKVGSEIFVFLSPGPNDIWYAYAVSKTPSAQECKIQSCLVLTGRVSGQMGSTLHILYNYENYNTPQLTKAQKLEIVLSIGRNGSVRVHQLLENGEVLPQPKMPMPELLGLIQSTASAAPAK